MPLPGTAFLALWNDCVPERPDYNLWHTREHLPERLSVPGILQARRYVAGETTTPHYFTLYALADSQVVLGERYRNLLDHPSPWSREMRPHLRRFLRFVCETRASVGAGLGTQLWIRLLWTHDAAALAQVTAALAGLEAVTAVHVGGIVPVAEVPWQTHRWDVGGNPNTVLVVESFLDGADGKMVAAMNDLLTRAPGLESITDFMAYRLAFALEQQDLPSVLTLRS